MLSQQFAGSFEVGVAAYVTKPELEEAFCRDSVKRGKVASYNTTLLLDEAGRWETGTCSKSTENWVGWGLRCIFRR